MSQAQALSRFAPLEHAAFQGLEHAHYLKGLLKPFKGNGGAEDLQAWATTCSALRDQVMELARLIVLPQAASYPFNRLPVQLTRQSTGAGLTFLRWRNLDRSTMGVNLWKMLMADKRTPDSLVDDLHAMELQRVVLNMQISLLHTLSRQGFEASDKMLSADQIRRQRRQSRRSSLSNA